MNVYLVGGAVRDKLLNLPVKDRDWVVVGASPDQLLALGFKQVGADFPVFLHPDTQEEHALARTERKQGHGYQGFDVAFGPDVTLDEDLIRRDLTINAMALDDQGNLIDPYGGKQDLENKLLRHVSDAFIEDPLRVLRVARFAARFHHLGFRIADETQKLMASITQSGELDHLTPERVWQETERALHETSPATYFSVLQKCGALAVCFPELNALFGVPQRPEYHPEVDTGVHSLMSLEQAARLSVKSEVRFAALIHDLGKALTDQDNWPSHHGHENLGLPAVEQLCDRLKTPNSYRVLALKTCEFHTHVHRAKELKSKTIWKVIKKLDALRKPEQFADFLLACKADARGRTGFEDTDYPQAKFMADAYQSIKQVTPQSLMEQGYSGAQLGQQLDIARIKAIQAFIQSETT